MSALPVRHYITRSVTVIACLGLLAGCVAPPPQVVRTTTTEQITLEQPPPVVSTTTTTIQRTQAP